MCMRGTILQTRSAEHFYGRNGTFRYPLGIRRRDGRVLPRVKLSGSAAPVARHNTKGSGNGMGKGTEKAE